MRIVEREYCVDGKVIRCNVYEGYDYWSKSNINKSTTHHMSNGSDCIIRCYDESGNLICYRN